VKKKRRYNVVSKRALSNSWAVLLTGFASVFGVALEAGVAIFLVDIAVICLKARLYRCLLKNDGTEIRIN